MSKKLKEFLDGLDKQEQAQDILEMIRKRQDESREEIRNDPKIQREAAKAYLAGFIDADGSISLAAKGGKDNFRTPCVEVYNTDINILNKIQKSFGGKIRMKKATKPNHADSYTLVFNTKESLTIIYECLPYMLHTKKKQRATLINDHYAKNTPRNGKYTPEQLANKKWLEENVMAIQMRGVDTTAFV